ncbi:MAG: hypothetical protein IJ415_03830 [Clostridia bacterium]|nr:hypothetical protein [Clostridia bacterium]
MTLDKNSIFYQNATKLLQEYIASGHKIEDLVCDDRVYKYIKNTRVYDAQGKLINLETKFKLLGYPRKAKCTKTLREDLIKEVNSYLVSGGSFHIERKKLPFYEKLHSYANLLNRQGIHLTYEQIMKNDLGFKEYSEMYYRCKDLDKLKYFRDEDGFVDSYKSNKMFNAYIKDVSISYGIPNFLVVSLLMDEKCKGYEIQTDKVKYTEILLKNYANEHGTFVGIRRKEPKIYNAFDFLTRYYSDGTEQRYSKLEWLNIFGLDHVEHRFKEVDNEDNIDVEDIMLSLKEKYKDEVVNLKEIEAKDYRKIIKKAVRLGVNVSQVFEIYGMKSNGVRSDRLSRVWVEEIPYFDEMKKRRNELLAQNLKSAGKKPCKEEIFEAKLLAVIQVYHEFKERLENYLPKEFEFNNNSNEEATRIL